MQTSMKIAVGGATGRVGRHVVEVLEARGHDVVPMSRTRGVDIITGEGLAAALVGVDCIIDAATGPPVVTARRRSPTSRPHCPDPFLLACCAQRSSTSSSRNSWSGEHRTR